MVNFGPVLVAVGNSQSGDLLLPSPSHGWSFAGGLGFGCSAGVVCAGGVALDVGSRKAALDAAGGRMNLLYAGAWAAAMALARSSGLLVLELEVDPVAGNSHTSVGTGSSFLLLAGVGSG